MLKTTFGRNLRAETFGSFINLNLDIVSDFELRISDFTQWGRKSLLLQAIFSIGWNALSFGRYFCIAGRGTAALFGGFVWLGQSTQKLIRPITSD